MSYLGDFVEDDTIHFMWDTNAADGQSVNRDINGEVRIYKDNGVSQTIAGVTDTEGFDGLSGIHACTIDTSADAFYAIGANYTVVLQEATIDGQVVNAVLAHFSIENRFIEVDLIKINGATTPVNNLELQYDTTGLTGATFPATQNQLESISLTGAAINQSAESYVLTTGTQSANTVTATIPLDGINHEHTDVGNDMDLYYQFDVAGDGVPTSVTMTGFLNSNNDDLEVLAFNWGGSSWDRVGTLNGKNASTNDVHTFTLFTSHVGTGANIGKVRVRFDAGSFTLSSATLAVDQIFVSFAVVRRTVGYANGAIWINTALSNTTTESFVDGTADNPVSTIGAAKIISGNINVVDFHVVNGSSITLGVETGHESYFGDNWSLALNSQDIHGAHFEGATITGVSISSDDEVSFDGCEFGGCTIELGHFDFCAFFGTMTLGKAGDYNFHNCYSKGDSVPIFTKTTDEAITMEMVNFVGGITISGIQSGDNYELDGNFRTITLNGASGTVHIHGTYESIIDNRSSSPILDIVGAIKSGDVADILVDTEVIGMTDLGGYE